MEYRLFRGVKEAWRGGGVDGPPGTGPKWPSRLLLICCSILRGSGRLVGGGGSALVTDEPTGGPSQT